MSDMQKRNDMEYVQKMIPYLLGFFGTFIVAFILLYNYKRNQPFMSKEQELYIDMELDNFDTILERTSPNWKNLRPSRNKK
jgi:hypothetical protein